MTFNVLDRRLVILSSIGICYIQWDRQHALHAHQVVLPKCLRYDVGVTLIRISGRYLGYENG